MSHLLWSPDTTTAFILNLDSVTPAELSAEYVRNEDCTHYYRSTGLAKTGGEIHGPDGERPGPPPVEHLGAEEHVPDKGRFWAVAFISSLMSSFLFLALTNQS